jgi:xylan 1,4-beta-xylosidase
MSTPTRLIRFATLVIFCVLATGMATHAQKRSTTADRVIRVDYSAVRGPINPMFNACVGAGRANEGLRADWQQQLARAHTECGFRFIRFHGILTDDMGSTLKMQKEIPSTISSTWMCSSTLF